MLNKRLYNQLESAFGEVRITNENRPFVGHLYRDALNPKGGLRVRVEDKGESYAVCCPFCGDQRFRLYFGHRWGTKLKGTPIRYAAVCFNEECHMRPDFYGRVTDMLDGYLKADKPIEDAKQTAAPAALSMPGDCIPVSELPSDHFAVQYLLERDYDITELADVWGISWRLSGSALADHYRLIIPIYAGTPENAYLAGWQARYLTPQGSKPSSKHIPKYMTSPGLRKSQLLYNGWRMSQSSVAVVTEGPFDAIRCGLGGVAVLGFDASRRQEQLLVQNWADNTSPVVVMLDNDMEDKAQNLVMRLQSQGCAAVRARAPEGKDPGDCTVAQLIEVVSKALETLIPA